jgi:hypothetical protein
VLIDFFDRLEKRRQAMLEMPQMIQTWKEVIVFELFGDFGQTLMMNYREGTAEDGKNGRNNFIKRSPTFSTHYVRYNPGVVLEHGVGKMRSALECTVPVHQWVYEPYIIIGEMSGEFPLGAFFSTFGYSSLQNVYFESVLLLWMQRKLSVRLHRPE